MIQDDAHNVRTVVLIDDDEDFLHILSHRLGAQQHEFAGESPVEILTFTDPVEALVNLPESGICVVVVDYNMPQGTGLEWLPKILATAPGPVLLLTNQNDAILAAEAFRSGASDYIVKTDVMTEENRLSRSIREAVHRYRLEVRNHALKRQLKLVNVELESKNKRLRELTETAHQFVDDVAHDFRTPLTVIQQYASMVAEGMNGPVSSAQVASIATITEATREMTEMVDDFLDSSKLRAKALSMDRQRHTVAELFEAIEPLLKVRAEPREIHTSFDVAEGLPAFFADKSKTGRVLTNLIVNAIKVSRVGSPLRIAAQRSEQGDIRIGVTDEGPGLKGTDLKIIFDRFKQVDESQVTAIKGFGLGLAIVKHLAWLNLGSIEVCSELGKGSTFSFTLPAFNISRILDCFLQRIRGVDDAGDVWSLRIRSPGEAADVSILRRIISTFSYPMDIILEGNDGRSVIALGLSSDVKAWAARIGGEASRFHKSIRPQESVTPEITPIRSWKRDIDSAALEASISCHLNMEACHV